MYQRIFTLYNIAICINILLHVMQHSDMYQHIFHMLQTYTAYICTCASIKMEIEELEEFSVYPSELSLVMQYLFNCGGMSDCADNVY